MQDATASVLILHQMGNPSLVPGFMPKHLRSFAETFPNSPCLFHDISLPLPEHVSRLPFDAVFLDVTALRARWRGERAREAIEKQCAFLSETPAFKVAFPQDEYDCNEILDEWMCRWKVDLVISVLACNHDVLYPQYHKHGKIELGYTGYVDEAMIDREWTEWRRRPIDVGYRAKRLPPYFGRVGETKWRIAEAFLANAQGSQLRTDIAVGDRHSIRGQAWMEFVQSCKFMLGSPSGSSLLDPHGRIQASVREYLRRHPHADYGEVERQCFAGLEGRWHFTAISPRNIEAALAGTGQVLVDGDYSGLLRSGEHFVRLAADAGNFREAHERMLDSTGMSGMIHRCREALLAQPRLRYRTRDEELMDRIEAHGVTPGSAEKRVLVRQAVSDYQQQFEGHYRLLWKSQLRRYRIGQAIDRMPSPAAAGVRALLTALRGVK